MIIHFLSWWYGPGIKRTIAQTDKRALGVLDDFSVGLLARTWFAPMEIPVGVITAFVGGPFFIAMLWRGAAREAR